MIEFLPMLLLGIAAGAMGGMLPGVGTSVLMMLFFPILLNSTPMEILAFYIGAISTSQYVGSIVATIFAVPGESSSLPAVREGHAMFRNGQGSYAISGAAIGGFFGSTIVVFATYLIVPYIENFIYLFTTTNQAIILIVVIFSLCFSTKQSFITSLLLVVFGYFLGLVGCRAIDNFCFGTTIGDYRISNHLIGGLPLVPVIMAIYVVPLIVNHWPTQENKISPTIVKNLKIGLFLDHIKKVLTNWQSLIRGSCIGYIAGLAPGFSLTLASNLSYSIERKIQSRKGKYQEGNYNCLLSAETANNAAAFTTLIPVLVFGIPMALSETILYELSAARGLVYGRSSFSYEFFITLAYMLVITNFIALFISWPAAKYLCYVYVIPQKIMYIGILILLMWIIYYIGSINWLEWYYVSVFFVLLPIGLLLRKFDTLPLVFTFIVQSRIDAVTIRLFDLYW